MNQRIAHDASCACALSIIEVFDGILRPEEKKDAFSEVYDRVKAAIEAFCIQSAREDARLCRPSKN